MILRKITEAEKTEYILLSRYAFGEWKDGDAKDDEIAWFDPETAWAVFVDGKIESSTINHRMVQSVRGVPKKMGAIGNVATNPIHRRKGFVRELFKHVFDEMHELQMPVSMLSPFKRTYYEMFGYVAASRGMEIEFDTRGLVHYINTELPEDIEMVQLDFHDDWTEYIDYCHTQGIRQHHGYVSPKILPEGFRQELRKDRIAIVVRDEQGIRGSAIYAKKRDETTGFAYFRILDFVYSDRPARDAILQFFARHFENVGRIRMHLPYGVNPFEFLIDPQMLIQSKLGSNPWMVRVMDVAGALNDLPAPTAGRLVIGVTDPLCAWNNGTWVVESDGKKLQATAAKMIPDIEMDIRGLSSLVYGALDPDEIIYRGMIRNTDACPSKLLKSWFPKEYIYTFVHF